MTFSQNALNNLLTNCTGLPISTGVSGMGSGMATFLATPNSANLAATVTDEVGTGSLTFQSSGTFTPIILGLSTAGSPTYVSQIGVYRRTGNSFAYGLRITISAIGGMVGQLAIGGLPITVESSQIYPQSVGTYSNAAVAITTAPIAVAQGGTNTIRLWKNGAGTAATFTNTDITATFEIYISGTILI